MANATKDETARYEKLQKEYKKLFSEYEQIKADDPTDPELEKKLEEITEKQQELQTIFSKLT